VLLGHVALLDSLSADIEDALSKTAGVKGVRGEGKFGSDVPDPTDAVLDQARAACGRCAAPVFR
jgi:hypothetical protein